jgi:ABC-type Fe3+ transport system permease subunit
MMVVRELTIPVFLTTGVNNLTLPVMIYNIWQSGDGMQTSSAMTLLFLAMVLPLIILYLWLTGRNERRAAAHVAKNAAASRADPATTALALDTTAAPSEVPIRVLG